MIYFDFSPKDALLGKKIVTKKTHSKAPDRFRENTARLTLCCGEKNIFVEEFDFENHDVDGVNAAMGMSCAPMYSVTVDLTENFGETFFVYHISGGKGEVLTEGVKSLEAGDVTFLSTQYFAEDSEFLTEALSGVLYLYKSKIKKRSDVENYSDIIFALLKELLGARDNEAHLLLFHDMREGFNGSCSDEGKLCEIYKNVLKDVVAVRTVQICEGTKEIGAREFRDCGDISEIILPESLEIIGEEAFSWCVTLEKITIPKNVKEIPFGCFWWCKSLKEVTLPANIEFIGNCAFRECRELTRINYGGTMAQWEKIAAENYEGVTVICADGEIRA